MAMKLPRATIEELDQLVEQLTKPDPERREAALRRLESYERSGQLPLEALVEYSQSDYAPLSMYAIAALGRNGQPGAVKKLSELLEQHRQGNPLVLETVIDALGETGDANATGPLMALLGIRSGWSGRLFGRKSKDEDAQQERQRERLVLPVLRALGKVVDPKGAELLGAYLEHADHLVRWHALQCIARGQSALFNDRVRALADKDPHQLVRDAAQLLLTKLAPLPPNLSN